MYWGIESGNYPNYVDVGGVLTTTIRGFDQGPYFFVATAFSGEYESGYSNEVSVK